MQWWLWRVLNYYCNKKYIFIFCNEEYFLISSNEKYIFILSILNKNSIYLGQITTTIATKLQSKYITKYFDDDDVKTVIDVLQSQV